MGLSINPGHATWAYSGFMAFRERLAAAEGLNLREMKGFGGEKSWDTSNGDPITTLKPLLYHSDCDGHLDPWECEQVLPRLRAIVREWDADGSWGYDTDQASRLIDGMEHCVAHGCALVFG